jgi:CheY-like chemotaxis protein
MRLDYRILWFEDQPNNVRHHSENIGAAIARLGFMPMIEIREVVAGGNNPLANLPSQHDVDLVLIDWKLGGGQDGAQLARRLHRSFRDTDIIFYSSEAQHKLRDLIHAEGLDGVHCVTRTSLTDRTMGLVRAQLRRMLDLNHMRGIVMAATSDLDQAMIQCLEVVQALVYPSESQQFAVRMGKKIADSLRKKAAEIEKLAKNGRLDKLLREPAFGAALRLTALQREIEKIAERIQEAHLIEALGRYDTEVIKPRNDFAHRRAIVQDGKLFLEGREQPFDQQSMISLRLRLLDHADNLRALLSLLEEMAHPAGQPALAADIADVGHVVAAAEQAIEEAAKAAKDSDVRPRAR